MTRVLKLESAQSGSTDDARRVLEDINAVTPEPTVPGNGVALGGTEHQYVTFKVSGSDPAFYVKFFVYSYTSETWSPMPVSLPAIRSDVRHRVSFQGQPCRLYIQVVGVNGTTPLLDAWVENVVDTP